MTERWLSAPPQVRLPPTAAAEGENNSPPPSPAGTVTAGPAAARSAGTHMGSDGSWRAPSLCSRGGTNRSVAPSRQQQNPRNHFNPGGGRLRPSSTRGHKCWLRLCPQVKFGTGNSPAVKTRGSALAPRLVEGCECWAGSRGRWCSHIRWPHGGHRHRHHRWLTGCNAQFCYGTQRRGGILLPGLCEPLARKKGKGSSTELEHPLPRGRAPVPPGSAYSPRIATSLLGPVGVSGPEAPQHPRSRACPCLAPGCVQGVKTGARPATCPRSLRNKGWTWPPPAPSPTPGAIPQL